jgi:putative phage-type endonuclease
MKILKQDQNSEAWFDQRKGLITGSKLKGIVVKRGTSKKIGYYELMAEQLATPEAYEDPMERGSRLEDEAIKLFSDTMGKEVERVGLCVSDFNPRIALSPDGLIKTDGKYKEAIEIKCLSSARHLQAHFEQEVPADYKEQAIQYFIVNENLEMLYFTLYDPRITILPLVVVEMKREDVEEDIKFYREYQETTLKEIDEQLSNLAF